MRPITRRNAIARVGALTVATAATFGAWPSGAAPRTGKVAVSGGKVTYWVVGEGRGLPILMVHGGPWWQPRLHDASGCA